MRLFHERRFSSSPSSDLVFRGSGDIIQSDTIKCFVVFSAQYKKIELWLACKSLASSLCVEVRLLTQIFDTSSQLVSQGVFHLLPVDSAVGGTKHCIVLENWMLLCCI